MPSKNNRQSSAKTHAHVKKAILICLSAIIVILLAAFLFTMGSSFSESAKMKEDLIRLSEETYDSVLLSMHSTEQFREDDFSYYLAQNTAIMTHAVENSKELSKYLEHILASGNEISNIYLCLDPGLLWNSVGKNAAKWHDSLTRDLYNCIESHPQITFDILLPYPHIDYWRSLSQKELDATLTTYHTMVNEVSSYPNAITFFPGMEEWIIMSPGNYENTPFDAVEDIVFALFANTFCGNGTYQITPENEDVFWNALRQIIQREQKSPTQYPDLSDWCFVLFGDSVLGNYTGSTSIPGYITSLSGASVFNFAIGGTSAACRGREEGDDLPDIFGRFVKENIMISQNGNTFSPQGAQPDTFEGKKLCFLFNYGLNDYYSGVPVENPQSPNDAATYKGSLRTSIQALKIMLPDAYYVIMSPTHTKLFSFGMDSMSEEGSALPAYVNGAEELASELGLYFLDNYHDFIVTDDTLDIYLSDGTHPNERGRYAIAARLVEFIANLSQ